MEISTQKKRYGTCDLMNFCQMRPEQLPMIGTVLSRFERTAKVTLSSLMKSVVGLKGLPAGITSFSSYLSAVDAPSFLSVVKLGSLSGAGLIEIDQNIGYGFIERLLGSTEPGVEVLSASKDATPVELAVLREVISQVIDDMNASWKPLYEMNLAFTRIEVLPDFVGITGPDDSVFVKEYEVGLDTCSGRMRIVLPMRAMFPIRDQLI